jgi:Zn-dependent protease/CBS domain-containing protein
MSGNGIPIGKAFGISLRLHFSWFIIFVLVTWGLVMGYFPGAFPQWDMPATIIAGIVSSLLFFGSVLAHELMHSIVAQKQGIPVKSITLFVFGGVSEISEEPKRPQDEFIMALAGPLTSLVLGIVFLSIWYFLKAAPEPVIAISFWLGWINILLAGFNLIPGFPLDGGRVLRSLIWWRNNDLQKATRIAAKTGQVIGYLIIAGGVALIFTGNWLNGLWLALIGWFLQNAAAGSYRQMALEDLLRGRKAHEVMTQDCNQVSPSMSVQGLVSDGILAQGKRCFSVVEGGRLLGLVTLHNVKTVPRELWQSRSVRDVMTPLHKLRSVSPETELGTVLKIIIGENINQVPVMKEDAIVGMISRENILKYINIRSELGV